MHDEPVSIINALRCSSDDVFYDVINNKSIINNRYLDEMLRGTYLHDDVSYKKYLHFSIIVLYYPPNKFSAKADER